MFWINFLVLILKITKRFNNTIIQIINMHHVLFSFGCILLVFMQNTLILLFMNSIHYFQPDHCYTLSSSQISHTARFEPTQNFKPRMKLCSTTAGRYDILCFVLIDLIDLVTTVRKTSHYYLAGHLKPVQFEITSSSNANFVWKKSSVNKTFRY